jgi:hypothetical protein
VFASADLVEKTFGDIDIWINDAMVTFFRGVGDHAGGIPLLAARAAGRPKLAKRRLAATEKLGPAP